MKNHGTKSEGKQYYDRQLPQPQSNCPQKTEKWNRLYPRPKGSGNDNGFDETLDNTVDREEDGEYEEPQEPLYPGVYRALYAFGPEGMVEMELKENQLVRVVGGGGGVGWAVVVDECGGDKERGKVQVKHTLVPEVGLDGLGGRRGRVEVAENED